MKFVEAVGRPISVCYKSRLNKKTGKICQYPIPNTYQYIPIHQTIRFVYSHMYDILKKQQRNTNNLISDFSDASRFKECQLFIENSDALQLNLYFDDFETVNPLGSKTKIHKLSAVYMMIRNLPSYLNSRLMHIYLVCLFYTEDTKTTRGYEPVFEKMIKDINTLEIKGIEIVLGKACQTVKGTVVLFSAENLGAHRILAFQEGFTFGCICRLCYATVESIQDHHRARDFEPRTAEQHEKDVQDCNTRNTGVKRQSPFNDLHYFKVTDNYCVDAMHDIFEGVFPNVLKSVLYQLIIVDKIFTCNQLNSRLKAFRYATHEKRDKSSCITLEKLKSGDNLLGQRAALCLSRLIGLILGDLIDCENTY
ncbi:uncharacterized protein LOC124816322 [Hydra vulgaris]|uniref:uncharacterized protein LOC124816322 n=1 Tax=Hydra vulgaris TaxID=6087 RepID=UPI001F5F910F|nr:uncharacterized protein LOC124816322 [Hydra vulgaris]